MIYTKFDIWFRSGYEKAAKDFPAGHLEGINTAGKSYMVTGANSGMSWYNIVIYYLPVYDLGLSDCARVSLDWLLHSFF